MPNSEIVTYNQFNNALKLKQLFNLMENYLTEHADDFHLETAKGRILDIIGSRLSMPRPIVSLASAGAFHYDIPADQNGYDEGKYDGDNIKSLGDTKYRLLLKAIIILRFNQLTVPNILKAFRLLDPTVVIKVFDPNFNRGKFEIHFSKNGDTVILPIIARYFKPVAGVKVDFKFV